MDNEEEKTTRTEDHLKSARIRHRRRRLVVWMLLAFVVAAVCMIYAPFQSKYLDARFSAAWKNATGLDLEFGKATYDLVDGRLMLEGIRIPASQPGDKPVLIKRIDMHWRWVLYDLSKLFELDRIDIRPPENLKVRVEEGGRLVPYGELKSYVDLFSNLKKVPGSSEKEQKLDLMVTISGVAFQIESATSPSLTQDSLPLFALNNMAMELRLDTTRRWVMEVRGHLPTSRNAAPIRLVVKPGVENAATFTSPDSQAVTTSFSFSLKSNALDLKKNFAYPLPFNAAVSDLQIDGTITPLSTWNRLRLSTTWTIADVEITPARNKPSISVPPATLQMQGILDFTQRVLDLEKVQIDTLDTKATLSGRFNIGNNWHYTCDMEQAEFPATTLNMMQRILPDFSSWNTTFTQGLIRPVLHIEGDQTGLNWNRLRAKVRTVDLCGISPMTGVEVGPVVAEAEFTSRSLRVAQLDVQLPPGRLTVSSAEFNRTGAAWLEGVQARASWTVDFDAEKLLEFLPHMRVQVPESLQAHGQVAGYGSLRGPWIPPVLKKNKSIAKEILASFETVDIDGVIRLQNGSLDYDVLPAPISGLAGSMTLSGKSAFFKDLEGTMLGSKASIICTLTGEERAWKNPRLDLNVAGSIDLKRLPDILKADAQGRWLNPNRRAFLNKLSPQGLARAEIGIKGLILGETPFEITGSVIAEALEYDLDLPEAKGVVKIRKANLTMRTDRIVIDELTGSLDTIDFKTSGTIFGNRCDLRLVTSGDLEVYRTAIPASLHDSREAGGPVRIAGWARGWLPTDDTQTPVEFIRSLGNGEGEEQIKWDYRLAVDAKNCHYTYATLPVGAEKITGRLFIEPHKMTTDGFIRSQWGSSGMGLTSGTINVIPLVKSDPMAPWKTHQAAIRFSGRFPRVLVDEWITGWRPRPPSSPPRQTAKVSSGALFSEKLQRGFLQDAVITGDLVADEVAWKNFRFQKVSTRLISHHYTSTYPSFLEFRNLRAQAYGGAAACDLAFLLRHPKPEWNWRIEARDVEMRDFLSAWVETKPSVSGKMSGNLSLTAQNADKKSYRGQGQMLLRKGVFSGNPIFSSMGKLLSVPEMENTSFDTIEGVFMVGDGKVQSPGLQLKSTLLDLVASGQTDIETAELDLDVVYKFFGRLDKIPLVSTLTNLMTSATGTILKMRIRGTLNEPEMTFLPSLDDLNVFKERAKSQKEVKLFPCPLLPEEVSKL